MNGKTMATLLEKTRCNTAYLRRHVKVVEMWECEWKEVRNESDVKTFLTPSSRPRWTMTQQQILAAVVDGTLFIPNEQCATSASQKNCKTTFPKCSLCSRTRASLEMTSDRSCVSMPKNMTFSRSHASCLWVAFVVSRSCSQHHCYDGTSRMDSWWIECTKSSSTNLTPAFDGLVSPFPQLDALEMKTLTKPSLPTR